jgi:phosphoglycolate phosphatase
MLDLCHKLSRIHAIAFDLDGTLVDSAPDIGHALNTALAQHGLARFDLDTVRGWIGGGPDLLIRRALARLDRAGDDALHARLRSGFDAATLAAPLLHGAVFDGIDEMVEGLFTACPLVVVTNKPTPLARAVLAAAGLLPFMSAVHGADRADQLKPAPTLLTAAAAQLAVQPGQLLMVGDSSADLLAAHAAGCPVALVGWGYGAHAVADGVTPWHVAAPAQLLAGIAVRFEEEAG